MNFKLKYDQIDHISVGMTQALLTTAQAARLAGVAPSTVKRWGDEGVLTCVRTAGGHRRFARGALERFVLSQSTPAAQAQSFVDGWIHRLVDGRRYEAEGALLDARARLGAWHRVTDELGPVITELGRRWKSGRLTIAAEHVASDCLGRALALIAEAQPVRADAPRALLACAEGDEHTLGLSLTELCLRELGWVPLWLGGRTPTAQLVQTVQGGRAQLVALSASSHSSDARALTAIARKIGAVCRARAVPLVLGGSGAWPQQPAGAVRLRTFGELHDWVSGLEPRR
ncbi:MAG: binding domain protein, excisionase family [Myxococcaceae bacterium]|nr:binding domain protein, excisionase family [Myxococcaceae bacterium]